MPFVVRKDIRAMDNDEQMRFVNAVKHMMKNKNGPSTSNYYQSAMIHADVEGRRYCHYGRESFASWNRLYLREFEKKLSSADKKIGGNGQLALPYWDPLSVSNNEFFPNVIRHFNDLPSDLFPDNQSIKINRIEPKLMDEKFGVYKTVQFVVHGITKSYPLMQEIHRALLAKTYNKFVEMIEEITLDINTIIGFPMNDLNLASFDVLFWCHYANIDRIYESYLKMQKIELLKEQFGSYKQTTLNPFLHKDGSQCYTKDTLITEQMGYIYDSTER